MSELVVRIAPAGHACWYAAAGGGSFIWCDEAAPLTIPYQPTPRPKLVLTPSRRRGARHKDSGSDMRNDPTTATAGIELSELTAILAEVRRAILAVDAGTGEHPPLRTLTLTLAPPGETDAADAAVGG